MTRRRDPRSRVIGAFVRIPEPLTDGKVRCNGCGKAVPLTPNGHIRRHKSPAGEPCAYTASYRPVRLDEIPPVSIRPEPKPRPRKPQPSRAKGLSDGECRECGKWLPGNRSLCGACSVRAERARKRKR